MTLQEKIYKRNLKSKIELNFLELTTNINCKYELIDLCFNNNILEITFFLKNTIKIINKHEFNVYFTMIPKGGFSYSTTEHDFHFTTPSQYFKISSTKEIKRLLNNIYEASNEYRK